MQIRVVKKGREGPTSDPPMVGTIIKGINTSEPAIDK
jgi:hypothetical protein